MRKRVDIEHLEWIFSVLKEIDKIPFEDIDWYQEDKPLIVSEQVVKDWKFIGLNNTDFVEFEIYKEKQ